MLPPSATEMILAEGFTQGGGARELKRAVDRFVAEPISNALVEGSARDGNTVNLSLSTPP